MSPSKKAKLDRAVPDTSVIINEIISTQIKQNKLQITELILHEAMLAELEHIANQRKESGFIGLEEIKTLRALEAKKKLKIKYAGDRPTAGQIKYAKAGEIDAVIRKTAQELDATLISADRVQAEVGKAIGMKVLFIPYEVKEKEFPFLKYFKKNYMSIHLREGAPVKAKAGFPGQWEFIEVTKKNLTETELENLAADIIEAAINLPNCFLELDRPGSSICQLKNFRIVITKPPLSDGWEITIVRPVKELDLDDYNLSDKLKKRLHEKAEGIIIAGAPGHGKSTITRAIALSYNKLGKVVKAIEAPRDMSLPPGITQYALSKATSEELRDIMLLTRPDYTVFDEMRNTANFKLYADLRLAGVGMLGVVHATKAVDAIQRFMGRLELGTIPSVVDTVVFIKHGMPDQILALSMEVKVPSGMLEADLARPVVEMRDFETGKLEFEAYTYGEQTVIIPVKAQKKTEFDILLEKTIKQNIQKKLNLKSLEVEYLGPKSFALYVLEKEIPRVIGSKGERINSLEKALGVSIDVRPLGQSHGYTEFEPIPYSVEETKKYIVFYLKKQTRSATLKVSGREIASYQPSHSGEIMINKKSKTGKQIVNALDRGKEILFY